MANWVDPCPTCPRKYGAIGGDGPQPAAVLGIAERPGERENRSGRVLDGNTGQELDELYLPLAGLDRRAVRACNTVLCWADSNKTPSDKEIAACAAHHLPQEIALTNPEVIILMGATPCSLLPAIKLKMMHGIPQHTSKVGTLYGWSGWIVPIAHPAQGLHESRWMKTMMDDWRELGDILREDRFELDPDPEPTDYHYVRGASAVSEYFNSCQVDDYTIPAMDTESHGGRPWSMQVSAKPGTGILVRADDRDGLGCLNFWLGSGLWVWDIVMHHAAHDLSEAERMGVFITHYRDTMQEAFHLGDLPQGLKELSYRLFRHTMTSYKEVVRPASIRALQVWMQEALAVAVLDLTFIERVQLKTKVKEVVRKGELESLLTRLLRLTAPDAEYSPWGGPKEPRLDSFWLDPCNEWMTSHVEARVGKYPILGIANCTMDEAVRYAVGDADYTGRCAVELARRRESAFQISPGDSDAELYS